MNAASSRSHCLYSLTVQQVDTATGQVEAASRVAPHPSPLPMPNGSSALSLAARCSVRAASMGKPARAQVCTAQPSRSAHVSSRIATAAAWQPGGISGDPGDLQRRWAPSQSTCARIAPDRVIQARSRSRCAKRRGSVVALAMATVSMFGAADGVVGSATAKTHSRWSEKVPQRGGVAGSGGQRPAESGGPLGGCGGGCGGRGSGLDVGGGGAGLSSSARRSMGCGCRSANCRSSRVVCRAIEA